MEGHGGRCRGTVACPNGGIGNFPSGENVLLEGQKEQIILYRIIQMLHARVVYWAPTLNNDDVHKGCAGEERRKDKGMVRPVVPGGARVCLRKVTKVGRGLGD